jgi:hypothetical protein
MFFPSNKRPGFMPTSDKIQIILLLILPLVIREDRKIKD